MLRIIKILLVVSVGVFGLLGAFFNLIGWEGTIGSVGATTSMATIDGGGDSWQATSNPAVVFLGAAMIPVVKIVFGVLCLIGAWRMWHARKLGGSQFETAKELALAGCGVAILLLFAGWIVIGETWYMLWRSDALRDAALGSAFRYAGFVGLIALFVALRDDLHAS